MSNLAQFVNKAGRLGSTVAGISLFLMMLVGAFDIIGSKFLSMPLPAALEATEALMVITAFMALAYSQARREHISVDILFMKLPAKLRKILSLTSQLLTLGLFALLAWQGWHLGLNSLSVKEYASGVISFPLYPAKLLLAIGASLMVFQCIYGVVQEAISPLQNLKKDKNS